MVINHLLTGMILQVPVSTLTFYQIERGSLHNPRDPDYPVDEPC